MRRANVCVGVVIAIAVSAWAGQASAKTKAKSAPRGLELIPADTPWALVGLEPFPMSVLSDQLERVGKALDAVLAGMQAMSEEERKQLTPADRLGFAVIEELKGNLNKEGLERLGLKGDFRFVMYGLGIYPVSRWEIADGKKLRAAIDRVVKRAGFKQSVKKLGGQAYFQVSEGDLTIVLAVTESELILAMLPTANLSTTLPIVFGQKRVERSLAETAFEQIAKDYGYPRFAVGYIDSARVVSLLAGSEPGLHGDTMRASKELPEIPGTCRDELDAIAREVPRVVIGYPRFDKTGMTMEVVTELSAALRADLEGIAHALPGLGLAPAGDPLATFGLGVDLGKLSTWVGGLTKRAAASDCAPIASLENELSWLTTLPQWMQSLRGLVVTIQDVKVDPNVSIEIRGHALVHTSDPVALVEWIRTTLGLDKLTLRGDGKPVRIQLPVGYEQWLKEVYLARKGSAVALSVGTGTSAALPQIVGAARPKSGSLFVVTYDYAAFMSKLSGIMGTSGGSGDLWGLVQVYDRVGYEVVLVERGVALRIDSSMP